MPAALKQMKKALFGPDGYKNGIPYDFNSKGLVEAMDEFEDPTPNAQGYAMVNVIGPGGFFNTGMRDSTTSEVVKELHAKHNKPNECGACGSKTGQDGQALRNCSRCKDRRYCSRECQKKHWKLHKKVCEAVV